MHREEHEFMIELAMIVGRIDSRTQSEIDIALSRMEREANEREEREQLAVASGPLAMLRLILPMAKGYAAEHRVGSNAAYIAAAEETIAKAAEEL